MMVESTPPVTKCLPSRATLKAQVRPSCSSKVPTHRLFFRVHTLRRPSAPDDTSWRPCDIHATRRTLTSCPSNVCGEEKLEVFSAKIVFLLSQWMEAKPKNAKSILVSVPDRIFSSYPNTHSYCGLGQTVRTYPRQYFTTNNFSVTPTVRLHKLKDSFLVA